MASRRVQAMLSATKEGDMKILLAYDGMKRSKKALEEAAELARDGAAEPTIVSVVPEAEARATKAGGHRMLAPHAHQDVALAHRYLSDHGIPAEMKILHGDPVEELLREARKGGYDLIVVGSRELGPIGRAVLGSVSAKLVKEAPCPVLVVGEGASVRHEPQVPAN
jgi:nucleotide-binding universal stress UspA family protein